jgi:ribosome recycling factor
VAIEKAIQKSDLGLTPMNDGKMIRLAVPPLTEERRQELVKLVARRVEEARVAIRNLRRDAIETLRELEQEKMISEDEMYRTKDDIQELTDKVIERAEQLGKQKEDEILEV